MLDLILLTETHQLSRYYFFKSRCPTVFSLYCTMHYIDYVVSLSGKKYCNEAGFVACWISGVFNMCRGAYSLTKLQFILFYVSYVVRSFVHFLY